MEVKTIRNVIASALKQHSDDVRIVPIGNSVHLYKGDEEYEIVIRTMNPKGAIRFDGYGKGPTDIRTGGT
jgi:hypothetical protein